MSKPKGLALIAAGYVLSVGGGLAAVAVNELFMPADVAQTSPGMVAFGDMVLFVLVTGFLSLAPTWFLLKLLVEKTPRALLATELLIAADGPGELARDDYAGGDDPGGRPQPPPELASGREGTARPAHRLRRHSTHGLWPGLNHPDHRHLRCNWGGAQLDANTTIGHCQVEAFLVRIRGRAGCRHAACHHQDHQDEGFMGLIRYA
jgi:hypothetical protein